jgi:hypothetical protein
MMILKTTFRRQLYPQVKDMLYLAQSIKLSPLVYCVVVIQMRVVLYVCTVVTVIPVIIYSLLLSVGGGARGTIVR